MWVDYLLRISCTTATITPRAMTATKIITVVGNQGSVVAVVVVVVVDVVVDVAFDTVICCVPSPDTLHFAVAFRISPSTAGTLNVSDIPDALL